MKVSDFDYPLPAERIADRPPPNRPDSRLMVVRRDTEEISHQVFHDLPGLLTPDSLLILNDSKVIPARLEGTKRPGGARIEILLLEEKEPFLWEAIAQRAIRLSLGIRVEFPGGGWCQVVEECGDGRFLFRFEGISDWWGFLQTTGSIPLPPYILKKRENLPEEERLQIEQQDPERYQTVFAREPGSSAAPTAGLHFDPEILQGLDRRGVEIGTVTLHVGLDTFSPVTVEDLRDHRMKTEWCHCKPELVERIKARKETAGQVVAVGTTVCRTLEAYARSDWPKEPIRTGLFLKPGDRFLVVDALLTNFHLPRSTLLMLVSAFMGNSLRIRAYEAAIASGYRFYSYGDAMLIL